MITIDEIVSLLQERNFPVNLKELRICKIPRVKLSNDYYLKFSRDLVTGEYQAYITHKSVRQTTWDNIDAHSLTLALDYAEKVAGIVPIASIEQTPPSVVEPVQQAAVENGLRERSMSLVVTIFGIACITLVTSIGGIVAVNFQSCNEQIHSPAKGR